MPSTGWPANRSSLLGVKMRIRASPPASGGSTKTVSDRFSSRASGCISSAGTSSPEVNTASGLPSSGRSAKTSSTTYLISALSRASASP